MAIHKHETSDMFRGVTLARIKKAIRDSGIGMMYLSERSRSQTIDILSNMEPDQIQRVYDLATTREEAKPDPLEHIDRRFGLHEEVSIIYVVDGFTASFLTQDGSREVANATAPTIQEALNKLNTKLGEMS